MGFSKKEFQKKQKKNSRILTWTIMPLRKVGERLPLLPTNSIVDGVARGKSGPASLGGVLHNHDKIRFKWTRV